MKYTWFLGIIKYAKTEGRNRALSMNKISVLFFVALMTLFGIHHVEASQRFVDVPSNPDVPYEEINYLVDLGIIKGYQTNSGTYFKPNDWVTRGQVAKMVILATGNKPLIVPSSSFTDVTVGTELSGYAERAVQLGYLSASSEGKFAPNVPLKREEMSKILSIAFKLNADQYVSYDAPFSDVAKSHSYYKYINAVYFNGIAQGSAGKFNPSEAVKRSQFSSFVARAKSDKYRLDLPVQGVTVPDPNAALAKAKVTTNVLNVRSSTDTSSTTNILGKVYLGESLPVYEVQSSGWLKVAYNNRFAYVSSQYTEIVDPNAPDLGAVQKQVKATVEPVLLYESRSLTAKVLATFSKGETISVYATEGNWFLTEKNGAVGYVRIVQTDQASTVIPKPTQPGLSTKIVGSATVDGLHIRAQASGSSTSLGTLKRGDKVAVHSISGFWAKVSYNDISGYVNKTYLRLINQSGNAIAGRIIVLDPGHGGKDPGATSNGAVEKSIVLKVAEIVKRKLEADGAVVKMTRTDDGTYPTLPERVQFTLKEYAELFVSLHVNAASSTSAKGTETYYSISANENGKEDYALASFINNQIVKDADMYNRGVKQADYVVIRGTEIPSVLVELGFITNSADRAKLINDDYVTIYANAVYKGIVQYYSQN